MLRFHIWLILTIYYRMQQILLQNATAILFKMRLKFITECVRIFIKNCDGSSYYKLRQFYYKIWQLLQNTIFITNFDSTLAYEVFQWNLFPGLFYLIESLTCRAAAPVWWHFWISHLNIRTVNLDDLLTQQMCITTRYHQDLYLSVSHYSEYPN